MAAILYFVFSLGGFLVFLAAAALWLSLRPASPAGRRFLVLAIGLYGLLSVYAVPYLLSRPLVAGYHALSAEDIPQGRIAIVILSAGNNFAEDWSGRRFFYLNRINASRMWETHRVYRLAHDAWVISSEASGGGPSEPEPSNPAKRDALVQLGVPSSRIVTLGTARDTDDEARQIAPIARSLDVDGVVLVTSDIHMRRAIGTFRSRGIDAIPAIVRDPGLAANWNAWILPSSQGLELSGGLVHELLGLPFYAVREWLR
jgi:uncharacterized SAM-binding protein YcdF (DUF218 family)